MSSYSTQQLRIISRSDCDVWQKVDFIWQPAMTSLVVGLRRNSKALAKAKLAPKNVTVIVWWSATSLSHYSFLNHGENITSEKYAQQMRCTENCNACSQHWSTERAQFFSMTKPDHTSHNQCLKSWTNWATKFCHIHLTSHQLTTTSSSILTPSCRENESTTSRRQKMLSTSLSNPEVWIFIIQNKQTYFSSYSD